VVKFLQAEGMSEIKIHRKLAFMARTFPAERKCLWCNKFRDGRTAQNDDAAKQTKDFTH
jgi:hypothetical protein